MVRAGLESGISEQLLSKMKTASYLSHPTRGSHFLSIPSANFGGSRLAAVSCLLLDQHCGHGVAILLLIKTTADHCTRSIVVCG